MKKNVFLVLLISILSVFLIVSCKTTPTPEPAPTPEEPVSAPTQTGSTGPSQASMDALKKAIDSAEQARKRAIDFESPSYFPSDWNGAESQYTAAGNMPQSTDAQVQQATASYNAAAATYNNIFKKTIPLYAQARENEILDARDAVIATGLADTFPEYLREVDDISLLALRQYEGEDYYSARDTAADALYGYEALNVAASIYLTRQEIIDRGFVIYDPENFYKADEVALATIDAAEAGNFTDAEIYAEEAWLRYNLVLATGWAGYANSRRNSAAAERQRALNLKANVAVRDLYREAEISYNWAETALKSQQYDNAANLYTASEARFTIVSKEAEEKRRIADEAIREAENKIEQSDQAARNAEYIIEGGSR